MPRKSKTPKRPKQSPEQLRESILQAATELIQDHGLDGLSAREVARKINYSAGTLYNTFKDRDEIILTIESRLLDRLEDRLKEAGPSEDARQHVVCLASTYVDFAMEHHRLWSLLFEHRLASDKDTPEWYLEKVDSLMLPIEEALRPLMAGRTRTEVARSARVLWASIHGITSLGTAGKISMRASEASRSLVEDLVSTYLDGLAIVEKAA
jgi:AcrR family transcriptional regulator